MTDEPDIINKLADELEHTEIGDLAERCQGIEQRYGREVMDAALTRMLGRAEKPSNSFWTRRRRFPPKGK